MKRLLMLNGPNINLLGEREKDIYGDFTLKDIEQEVRDYLKSVGYSLDCFQSNHEGDLIDWIQEADKKYEGIIFNPAAYTHTSIALRDAIKTTDIPVVEVHISNIYKREEFRRKSITAPVCQGQIVGFGKNGYRLAAMALIDVGVFD